MTIAASVLSHVYPRGTRVNDLGHLELGGCDALALAQQFGTPSYIVVEDDLRSRAQEFLRETAARHRDFEVLYASKAFPCTAIYRAMAREGLSCDVASGGELALALRAGFDPEKIYLHGNAKSLRELREAVEAGVGCVVLDCADDLARLRSVVADVGRRQKVLLRVTPDVAGETHKSVSTGQANSKFGFGAAQARAAIDAIEGIDELELRGLHFHIGSQLFELEPFRAAIRALAELGDFPVYNLGGGLAAAYTTAQHPPSVADYVGALVDAAREQFGPDKRLLLEPGRALVANSTVTLYTVETVKRNVSTWVAVDGGMSDNLRPMLYGSIYEALVADRPLDPATERCHLAGKHCESGDVIVRDTALASPSPGDVIATPATGAYGYALANNYNGIPRAPVIFCREGNAWEVVRRESYEDLMSRDVITGGPNGG
jgi:diaminopimelate decarboxylase